MRAKLHSGSLSVDITTAGAFSVSDDQDVHEAYLELAKALGSPVLTPRDGESFEVTLVREATRRILGLPLIPWQRTRSIATLPNAKLTPTVVLARSLEKAQHGKIKSTWIGIEWSADSTFDYDYSSMAVHDLGMHRLVLERRLQRVAFGEDRDSETAYP